MADACWPLLLNLPLLQGRELRLAASKEGEAHELLASGGWIGVRAAGMLACLRPFPAAVLSACRLVQPFNLAL